MISASQVRFVGEGSPSTEINSSYFTVHGLTATPSLTGSNFIRAWSSEDTMAQRILTFKLEYRPLTFEKLQVRHKSATSHLKPLSLFVSLCIKFRVGNGCMLWKMASRANQSAMSIWTELINQWGEKLGTGKWESKWHLRVKEVTNCPHFWRIQRTLSPNLHWQVLSYNLRLPVESPCAWWSAGSRISMKSELRTKNTDFAAHLIHNNWMGRRKRSK